VTVAVMASTQNSPVLVQHSSPAHQLNPEVTIVSLSTFDHDSHLQITPLGPERHTEAPLADGDVPQPPDTAPTAPDMADIEMADAPPAPSEPVAEPVIQQAASEEVVVPPTQSPNTEVSTEHGQPSAAQSTSVAEPGHEESQAPTPPPIPPPEPGRNIPEWVTYEEDLSTPDEEELKGIESSGLEISALDVPSIEKRVYSDVDDPEQRPVKKIRLSWVIKGVRGTRDKPNYAPMMTSPCALVDGNYWQIKFFPRGNKCSSLSAYIRCTRSPPTPGEEVAESTFTYYHGAPDADMSDGATPTETIKVAAATTKPDEARDTPENQNRDSPTKHGDHGPTEDPAATPSQVTGDDAKEEDGSPPTDEEDWRISAQLGMVIYNPAEPRTNTCMFSAHQFAEHNDDWGWTDFVPAWNEIHIRHQGQRQALLRNDTIAIDAYIRIFEDPSQALWWHSCDDEEQWNSKSLAGYFPMGTPPLYHSPAVAGITAWLLLAPFRKVLQDVDALAWRTNSQIRPKPVICDLQMILYLMRTLRKESYVNVVRVIDAMKDLGETFNDVKSFWAAFRRTIELELDDEKESLRAIAAIFDSPDGVVSLPPLPVQGVKDVQEGLGQVLSQQNSGRRLPDFLPLMLDRQHYDRGSREWKLLHDRIILNEEIDTSQWRQPGDDQRDKYTLYGFMVHTGERNSGKFYSVLRPNGPGTKWLAFEDGEGNKVFSYTKKRIQEFEGLEGEQLKNFKSTRHTAYMAMYIRTSRLKEYLPGSLEPYNLPTWLKPFLDEPFHDDAADGAKEDAEQKLDNVNVEVYCDAGIIGRRGLLDMFNIRQQSLHQGHFRITQTSPEATFQDLRRQIAQKFNIDDPATIRLFVMNYSHVGYYTNAEMEPVSLKEQLNGKPRPSKQLCLWMSLLQTKEDIEQFADPDVEDAVKTAEPQPQPEQSSDSAASREDAPPSREPAAETLPGSTTEPSGRGGDGDEHSAAGPDAEQASIHEAVTAELERDPNSQVMNPAGSPTVAATDHASSPRPQEQPAPSGGSDTASPAVVEHGHLVDAVMQNDVATAEQGPSEVDGVESTATSGREVQLFAEQPNAIHENDAVIAALIAADAETAEFMQDAGLAIPDNSAPSAPRGGFIPTVMPTPPVESVYGFIQLFDVDNQDFVVQHTFFARYDDEVRETIRKCMGYGAEKEFNVWRRESSNHGLRVQPKVTFRDIKFVNGVDIIVGEELAEAKIEELEKEGKFSDPFDLSSYLCMVARRHPIAASTSSEPVEVGDFGTDYYKGPLVNGRAHGENGLRITSAGHIYEGPHICDKKSGPGGKMTYQNGDVYEGDWSNDERHGQGTFIENRTGNKYVGGFQDGKRWGQGTTYWQVSDEEASMCQICYSEEIDALFFDCGHVCACGECAKQCETCPICRRAVKLVVKMYRA